MDRAHNYWVATSRPDGSPHLAAVWGVWVDGAFHFSTGGRSRKARNLAADPRCVVSPEHAEESVVVEGVAERVAGHGELSKLMGCVSPQVWLGAPGPGPNPVFAVHPRVVFGIIEHDPEFSGSATRWVFGS